MTKEQIQAEAIRLAQQIEKISTIDCPRGVVNPGVYFGAMLMAEFLQDELNRLTQLINFSMAQDKSAREQLEEAETKISELQDRVQQETYLYTQLMIENSNLEDEVDSLRYALSEDGSID